MKDFYSVLSREAIGRVESSFHNVLSRRGGWWGRVETGLAVGAGGSRGKGQEDENMGQSTIIKYINSLNIYIVWVN